MRTMTVLAQRKIAVHAGEPVFVLGESLFHQADVKSAPCSLGPVFATSAVDVIDSEKLEMSLTAAKAFSSVGIYDNLLLLAVVVFQSLVIQSASPFEVFADLFLVGFAVAFANRKSMLLGFFVMLLALFIAAFALVGVVSLPSALPIFGVFFLVFFLVLPNVLGVVLFPLRDASTVFLGMTLTIAAACFSLLKSAYFRVFVGHYQIVERYLRSVNKEKSYGKRSRHWNINTSSAAREYRRISLGGFWQQCQNEKFSLIDLDAEMQTGRKDSDVHRERLSERTPLVGGAIVWASGNSNRKRAAEMTAPCSA